MQPIRSRTLTVADRVRMALHDRAEILETAPAFSAPAFSATAATYPL
jgi:hypothetical protein